MKAIGDWIRAIAPFPVDLAPSELSMLTIFTGLALPSVVPWIRGDAMDRLAMRRMHSGLAKLFDAIARPTVLLLIGMVCVIAIGYCWPGDSVASGRGAMDPTADLPDGWREFARLYLLASAILMIAVWNRPYFRVLVIVGGFLLVLELFYHVPLIDAAMRPAIDAIDPVGAAVSPTLPPR